MIQVTPELAERIKLKKAQYKEDQKVTAVSSQSVCMACGRPFAFFKMMEGRLYRITGTCRKHNKKVYHYPGCKSLKIKQVKISI